jgi:hypothetical protein
MRIKPIRSAALALAVCAGWLAWASPATIKKSSYDSTYNDALRRFDKMNFDELRMDIEPRVPDSGIALGHVIAYGHYLRPPYVVVAKDSAVYINNVQVHPHLPPPGMIAAHKAREESLARSPDSVTLYYHKKDSVERAAYPLYANAAAKYGRSKALKLTRDFILKRGVAEKIRMEPPSILLIYNKLTHGSVAVTFYTHEELKALIVTSASVDSGMHALAVRFASSYSSSLRRGHFLAFGGSSEASGYEWGFSRMRQVMQDQNLSLREKFARLVADGSPMATWIVANYSESEWSSAK